MSRIAALIRLGEILQELYVDKWSSRRVVGLAKLPAGAIAFQDSAVNNWHNILVEADKRRRVDSLVETAKGEYPERGADLDAAYQYYLTAIKDEPPGVNLAPPGAEPFADDRAGTEPDRLSHPGRLQVVLCHSSEDRQRARDLYQELEADGFRAWLEREDLMPGQSREAEIARQIRECDAVVALLGGAFHRQAGLEHKIIKWALEVHQEQPPGSIFLIPALIEECEVPDNLRDLSPVRLFEEGGHEKLKRSLKARGEQLLRSVSG
ncbi:MAG: toll/interleukin-1 receptor domain-containing protein [bacterium]|nr:toll/interleukin-1 receptor domain-containing protein [bacterium]